MATTSKLIRGYEVVIGLETHAQLSTQSKIFSGSSTQFGAAPNTQASPVDLALPGTLPVMNVGAVERAIRFGLAVGAHVAPLSIFARKNYFYPDLPKGYQISQYETPVVQGGAVEFFVGDVKHKVNLTRAHLEEDAGKSLHEDYAGQSGIDLNRAGTPLLEIVTEPDMRSSVEAVEYAKTLHQLVQWIGVCDGNMQEGSFRCDANVSVRKPGADYGTRREIKNLNSFKFMQQAIDFELQWQIDLIEDGGKVQQATVLFNPDTGETRAMRTKEDAADYRYFPDPDLPPLVIASEWIERVRQEMPELPDARRLRYEARYRKELREDIETSYNIVVYGLSPNDARQLARDKATGDYFEQTVSFLQKSNPFRWPDPLSTDSSCWYGQAVAVAINQLLASYLNKHLIGIQQSPIRPAQLAVLMDRQISGVITSKGMREVFEALWNEEGILTKRSDAEAAAKIDAYIDARGLKQMSDSGELDRILDEVLAANAKSVEEFRAGKEKAFNALVGQAMKATKGKANPTQVNDLLKKKLG